MNSIDLFDWDCVVCLMGGDEDWKKNRIWSYQWIDVFCKRDHIGLVNYLHLSFHTCIPKIILNCILAQLFWFAI